MYCLTAHQNMSSAKSSLYRKVRKRRGSAAAVETLKKITSPLKRPERLCQKTAVDCYDFSNNNKK